MAPRETLHTPAEMTDDAMDVTRSWFDTCNRGDLDAFIELYAADAEMTAPSIVDRDGNLQGSACDPPFL